MAAVRVAFDVGPLVGRRTGIGNAVASLRDGLGQRDDLELRPYLTSFRARRRDDVTRLPLPAAVAHRCWARADRPGVDRWLGGSDVVHGTNYVVPPSRMPRLVSVYDCWFLEHPDLANGDVRRAGEVLRRAVARGAVVHACSLATAAALSAHLPGAVVETVPLAPLPLPEAAPECPIPELRGRPFIVAIGTMERRKNLPTLVTAFGHVAEHVDDVLLVIAGGDGDDRRAVDEAILALPADVGRRVLLAGFVPDHARAWLLRQARVLAYPSLDEGFGFPLLDAMQAGTPIVASHVGSIPEVAGDAALLSPAADTHALARHLIEVLEDEALRARLREAGAQQLTTFDWARTAAAMAALYHRLAPGGTS